uniref:histone H2B 1/2-like n=1 Tax=Pristiophorus japonicus TaxID=55135 RepID=UPI00398F129C
MTFLGLKLGLKMTEEKKAAPKKGTTKALNKVSAKGGKKRRRFEVHPNAGISSKTTGSMSSSVNNIFEHSLGEVSRLVPIRTSTISSRESQSALCQLLPGGAPSACRVERDKGRATRYTSSK